MAAGEQRSGLSAGTPGLWCHWNAQQQRGVLLLHLLETAGDTGTARWGRKKRARCAVPVMCSMWDYFGLTSGASQHRMHKKMKVKKKNVLNNNICSLKSPQVSPQATSTLRFNAWGFWGLGDQHLLTETYEVQLWTVKITYTYFFFFFIIFS